MAGRSWGYWTRGKLDVLRAYLDAFTTATKNRTSERIYLDLFAGEVENHERLTDEHIDESARVALNIEDPPFSKLRFFELESNAAKLEAELRGEFPGRDIIVYGGDCNERIHDALTALRPSVEAGIGARIQVDSSARNLQYEWPCDLLHDFRHRP